MHFSTLQFFQDDAVKSSKQRKIRKLLQLLVRIALAIIVVIIFSRPFNKKDPFSTIKNPQGNIFIWIDPTASMSYVESGRSIHDNAGSFVDSIRQAIPQTAKVYLFDHSVKEFVLYDDVNGAEIGKTISNLNVKEAISEFENIKKTTPTATLFLCSDFQENTTNEIQELLDSYKGPQRVFLIPFTPDNPWNYTICDAQVIDHKVSVSIAAFGKKLEAGRISVHVNGIKSGDALIQVGQGDTERVAISESNTNAPGGTAVLMNTDPLQFDNSISYLRDNKNRNRILIIGNTESNFAIFSAISCLGSKQQYAIKLISESMLQYDDIDSANLLIINNLREFPPILKAFLINKNNRNTGKSVIYCISSNEYNGNNEIMSHLFPGRKYAHIRDTLPEGVALTDTSKEIWKGFSTLKVKDITVHKYVDGIGGNPLLYYSNRKNCATELIDSSGIKWILFSTSIGITDENNLCETGFYVPMLDRMVKIMLRYSAGEQNYWYTGNNYRNPFVKHKYAVSVLNETGLLFNDIRVNSFIAFNKPGIIKIIPQGMPPEFIAVRNALSESQLVYKKPDIVSGKKVFAIIESKDLLDKMRLRNYGAWMIFPWILLVLLILFEILLWERQSKRFS
jgi:hypothetical protein